MSRKLRKLTGAVIILIIVIIYGPIAMALADSRITQAPQVVQVICYMILGLAWVLPVMPIIKWMEKP